MFSNTTNEQNFYAVEFATTTKEMIEQAQRSPFYGTWTEGEQDENTFYMRDNLGVKVRITVEVVENPED